MKYIYLTKDERFNVSYNTIVGKTKEQWKVGSLIPMKIKLYESEDLKTKQWVVVEVLEYKEKYIKVKVVVL